MSTSSCGVLSSSSTWIETKFHPNPSCLPRNLILHSTYAHLAWYTHHWVNNHQDQFEPVFLFASAYGNLEYSITKKSFTVLCLSLFFLFEYLNKYKGKYNLPSKLNSNSEELHVKFNTWWHTLVLDAHHHKTLTNLLEIN